MNKVSNKKTSGNKFLILLIIILFGVPVIFFSLIFLFYYFFSPFQVAGMAMSPTYSNGSIVLTKKINSNAQGIQRADVVVFKYPLDTSKDFIKRVVALPGDKIKIEKGYVYINDQKLSEPYLAEGVMTTTGSDFLIEGVSIEVPENQYFILGDNRQYSSDSRSWGFVPQENIISVVESCVLNCN